MDASKRIFYVMLAVFSILIILSVLAISQLSYHKSKKLYADIEQRGIVTTAISYRESCDSRSKIRFYQFKVNSKLYYLAAKPDNSKIKVCHDTLGDTITILYLADNPNRHLAKQNLNRGISSPSEFFLGFLILMGAMMFYLVFALYDSNEQMYNKT